MVFELLELNRFFNIWAGEIHGIDVSGKDEDFWKPLQHKISNWNASGNKSLWKLFKLYKINVARNNTKIDCSIDGPQGTSKEKMINEKDYDFGKLLEFPKTERN